MFPAMSLHAIGPVHPGQAQFELAVCVPMDFFKTVNMSQFYTSVPMFGLSLRHVKVNYINSLTALFGKRRSKFCLSLTNF